MGRPLVALIDWFRLVTLSVIWGSSFMFVEIAVDHVDPFVIVFARVGLAAFALHVYCRTLGLRIPLDGGRPAQYLTMGFFAHALPFTLLAWGQIHITAGLASIYNATTPLFTILVAHICLADERATPARFAGVLTGFTGVFVLISGGFSVLTPDNLLGQLAALGAAMSYAASAIYGRRFSGLAPAGIAAATLTAATLLMAPLALFLGLAGMSAPDPGALAAIVTLALLCTAAAYILYFQILARAGATNLVLVTFLIPASAIMLGIVFLNETLAPNHLAGMALIFCGLLLVDGRVLRVFSRNRVRGV